MSADALLAERAATHGDADAVGELYAALTRAWRTYATNSPGPLQYPVDMIFVKLARIGCGDMTHEDHYADLEGYSTLARRMVAK